MRDRLIPETRLAKARIRSGVWEGVLTTDAPGDEPPRIAVFHQETQLEDVGVLPADDLPGNYLVTVPIPVELLSDGVQTFLICDAETGDKLNSFSIITGEPLEDDVRVEVDLLRAELDMLKKAFRRHCVETS